LTHEHKTCKNAVMQSAVTTSVFASTLNRLNHGWGCASFQIQAIKKTSRLVLSLPLVSDALLCGTTLSCSRHPFRWSVGDSLSTINTTINRLLLWHAQYNHTYLHLITFAPQTEHSPPKQSHLPPRAALHSSGLVRVEKPGIKLAAKTVLTDRQLCQLASEHTWHGHGNKADCCTMAHSSYRGNWWARRTLGELP